MTIRDVVTVSDTGSVDEHVVNTPTHVESDGIYIACVCDGNLTLTGPNGFTAVIENQAVISGDDSATFSLYKKTAGSSEPGSYTVRSSKDERAALLAFSVDNDNGIDLYDTADGDSDTATCPSVTTTGTDRLICRIVATEGYSIPHERLDGYTFTSEAGIGSGGSISLQYLTQATAGASGAETVDLDSNERWLGLTLAIALTAVTPPTPEADAGTVQELIDELQVDVDDSGEATWSDSDLLQFLNDGIKDYSVHFPRVVTVDIVTLDSVRRYNLPADYVKVVSVEYPANATAPAYLVHKRYWDPGFWDENGRYDEVNRRDNNLPNELVVSDSPSDGETIRIEYRAYHPHDLVLTDAVSVPSEHHHLLKASAVWQASRQLLMSEQQSPTNTSSLLMAQLSSNTQRLHDEYVRLLERTLFGVDNE